MSQRRAYDQVVRISWVLVLAASFVGAATHAAVASDIQPGSEPYVVDVVFDCADDATPNLIVPLLSYDEVFPVGTQTAEVDFSDFSENLNDTSLMIDCTPYDEADVECFTVQRLAGEDALFVGREQLGTYCKLPDPRPLGSGSNVRGLGPTSVDVVFGCAPPQTPNLIVPIRNYDEVFPAGTERTEFDFGAVEFIDTALMIDCTPYDEADVECFIVWPPFDEEVLDAEREQLGDYCRLPDARPIGGAAPTSTSSTPSTPPTMVAPSSEVTSPNQLPATGHGRGGAAAAAGTLLLGVLLVVAARSRPPRRSA